MNRWLPGLVGALSLAGLSSTAMGAAPARVNGALLPESRARHCLSIGSPTDGRLVGGEHLSEAPYLRIIPAYAGSDVRWGLDGLVDMIDRSARSVRRQFPDAVLSVGHLSRRGGGDIDRHASHESGRDADLGFYIRGQTGHPLYSDHMVSFRGDGTAPSWPGAFFDDARNWALVAAIAQETHARVTYLFVAEPLRARLLAYGARVGASQAIRNRAAELMVQPHGSLPHDDHFHVRIGCPSGMTACVELPTHARSHMLAAHHAPHHGALGATASTKGPRNAPPPPPVVPALPPVTPSEDEPTAPPETVAPPAAILAAPFDDVDGVYDGPGRPRHLEIQ